MASLFTSCFDTHHKGANNSQLLSSQDDALLAGHRPIDSINPVKCTFCNIDPSRFNIVLSDDKYICFTDRSPAAVHHLLVIPQKHIANVRSLSHCDADLVREMQQLGNKALDIVTSSLDTDAAKKRKQSSERSFGFHIPPFRSVDHLHLHCLQLPFASSWKALKYRVAQPPSKQYYKGWSWFAEWRQTCALLEAGRKVEVKSC